MKETININGEPYILESNVSLTLEQKNEVIRRLGENIQSSGCRSCVDKIRTLNPATGCGQTIRVGSSKQITATASGGNGNYKYELIIDGAVSQTFPTTGYSTATSNIFTQLFSIAGTHTVALRVTDSCATPIPCNDPSTGSCSIIVANPVVTSLSVSGCASAIAIGGTCTLTSTCLDQFNTAISCGTITWTSSNTSIATVLNGVVTGVSAGNATITATSGSISGAVSVTVNPPSCTTPVCGFTISA